ncbi:transposase-like zinc-binding domain-containing protein [Nodularia sp. UHCC 0506]|uniref:transposase-like zinc-binding domain-containing protein n=1 Tax=Nodularia sp. UHCC 0506 TaxID=3110243 RepID=UPI002B1F4AF5|nr:hypothetical protein [Nodularia sp. UHCC 0506]MEA5516562.1 hypothetical protein [Nodularia sp. UHCC 0506]
MKLSTSISLSVASLCAGFLLSSSGLKSNVALAAAAAIPTAFVTYLAVDSKAQSKINQALETNRKAGVTLHKVIRDFDSCKSRLATVTAQLEDLKSELAQARNTVNSLGRGKLECVGECERLLSQLNQLTQTIKQLELDREGDAGKITYYQELAIAWEENFTAKLETEVTHRLKLAKQTELEKIYQEHDQITEQSMELFRRLQSWSEKVAHGHNSKKEIIKSLANSYNQNLDQIGNAVEAERSNYLEQIELLNERVGQLQQALAGDLLEPEYKDFGFNESGRIANAIALWLYSQKQIPLRVTGAEEDGGIVTAGYSYSKAINPDGLVNLIKDSSKSIAQNLGIYAVTDVKKLPYADVLVVKFRRDRPQRKADKGTLYRSQQNFIDYILSQPVRLRIIGEPGAGKTPTALVLMSHLVKRGFLSGNMPTGKKLNYLKLAFCNPLAGISVKNSSDLDFCLQWDTAKAGFSGLASEYDFRKLPLNSEYKDNVGYLWIMDEFDNAVSDYPDGAKVFKTALKDGGHTNIGIIVLGQSAMVSNTKALKIDDMKMFTDIYIDPSSIRTFLTQYGDRFYSKSAVERAIANLEQLELELEEQNESIADTAREFRIAMVCQDRSPVFYQLPYFDSVDIDLESYQGQLSQIELLRRGQAVEGQTVCPHCGSTSHKKNGKAQGKQRLQCRDCNKNFLV